MLSVGGTFEGGIIVRLYTHSIEAHVLIETLTVLRGPLQLHSVIFKKRNLNSEMCDLLLISTRELAEDLLLHVLGKGGRVRGGIILVPEGILILHRGLRLNHLPSTWGWH